MCDLVLDGEFSLLGNRSNGPFCAAIYRIILASIAALFKAMRQETMAAVTASTATIPKHAKTQ